MDLSGQFLFFFSAIGVFNGLLLSGYCLLFNKKHLVSRYLFGGLLLMMCLRNSKSVMVYFEQTVELPWILVLGQSACLMIGPLLYSFIKVNIHQIKKWSSNVLMLLGISFGIVLFGIMVYPIDSHYIFWRNDSRDIVHGVLAFFIVLSAWELVSHSTDRDKMEKHQQWTWIIWSMNVLIGIGYVTALLTREYTIGPLVFSLLVYMILGYFIYNYNESDLLFTQSSRTINRIDDHTAKELLDRLSIVMREQQLFKRNDIRIGDVAGAIDIPKHQLSLLLNDNLGKRFSKYINEYRIDLACQIITTHSNYSIEGVGQEVGFKSKSTFFSVFKLMKGMTPLEFQKNNQS